MKRIALFIVLWFGIWVGQAQTEVSRERVEAALDRQMSHYPESTLQDIYKNFFQGVFGPGHIIADRNTAMEYLVKELELADTVPAVVLYEPVGTDSRYYRVDLSVVKSGKVTAEQMIEALVRSAAVPVKISVAQWAEQWREIETVVKERYPDLPAMEDDSRSIAELLAEGK